MLSENERAGTEATRVIGLLSIQRYGSTATRVVTTAVAVTEATTAMTHAGSDQQHREQTDKRRAASHGEQRDEAEVQQPDRI